MASQEVKGIGKVEYNQESSVSLLKTWRLMKPVRRKEWKRGGSQANGLLERSTV